jgi:pimeloyl-ACP methyl ester carboxylesterase
VQQLAAPDSSPPGANNWACRPSAAHPNPVVLTHGLGANQTVNWQTYSPLLVNNGYCVFSLTYGIPGDPLPVYQPGGLAPMEQSAAELSLFVDKVLAGTGASKVDILGHSEGTLMPNYYVKFLGGAAKVDKYVGLTPLWDGTTLYGLSNLYQFISANGFQPVIDGVLNPLCGSCKQFLHGSDFLAKMHSGGGVFAPEVTYTNIVTRYDELVLPYTSGLGSGPNVHNIVLQDQCVLDFAEHVGVAADRNAARHVLNALDPAHAQPVPCLPAGPLGS